MIDQTKLPKSITSKYDDLTATNYRQSRHGDDYYYLTTKDHDTHVPFQLIKLNNRGATLRTHMLSGKPIDIFLSRSFWEIKY